MKPPDQLEPWQLTDAQKLTLVGVLAHHLVHLDPSGAGVRLVDFIASLYPPQPSDGRDAVRAAAEKLTRTVAGRTPEAVRLGRIFGANKRRQLPGNLQLKSCAFDMERNCALWAAVGEPDAEAPVLSGTEIVAPPPKGRRRVEDDTPACRERVERFIGAWLVQHRQELPGKPAEFEVVSAAGVDAADLALYIGCFVLVMYTRDMVSDPRLRLTTRQWKALADAHARGATIFICMCNDEPGYFSFNTYQDYLDQNRTVEEDGVYWPMELATWIANFKQVLPHILSFRTAVSTDAQMANVPKLSRFLRMMLRQEPELAEAMTRGWLLSTMRPEDGVISYWAQRCEVESAIDLYVCVYQASRGRIPSVPTCTARLDLCPAGLTFSEAQLHAVLDGLAALLSRTDPAVAEAMSPANTKDWVTMAEGTAKRSALVATPRVIAFTCAGVVARQVGELLYEHATRLRPKRLSALGR